MRCWTGTRAIDITGYARYYFTGVHAPSDHGLTSHGQEP